MGVAGLAPAMLDYTFSFIRQQSPQAARVFFPVGLAVSGCQAHRKNLMRTTEGGEEKGRARGLPAPRQGTLCGGEVSSRSGQGTQSRLYLRPQHPLLKSYGTGCIS